MLPEKDMVTRRSSSSNTCSDNNGTMPSCAPLAVPYVPFQQENSSVYAQNEALAQGTLFPGLNLPFYLKPDGEPVPVTPLTELQALDFVLSELGLYLDTHQGDSEAFALFQQYDELEREGRAKYQALYGPLTRGATAADNHYTWIHGPWPWEQKGEK